MGKKGENKSTKIGVVIGPETYKELMFIAGYRGKAFSHIASELLIPAVAEYNNRVLQEIRGSNADCSA